MSNRRELRPAASVTFVTRLLFVPFTLTLAMSSSTSNNTPVDIMDIDDDTQSEL